MPNAITFSISPTPEIIPGVAIEGLILPPRELQVRTTKFWGVTGESRIQGKTGGRQLDIPVLLYDDSGTPKFTTKAELATYIDDDLNQQLVGQTASMTVHSESNYPAFTNCTFDGIVILGGIKTDHAGSLGGGPFALGRVIVRQHA